MQIKNAQDFWAGIMFIAVGLFFMIVALGTPAWLNELLGRKLVAGYQLGTAVRMGPAYFPVVLGIMMAVLGGIVLVRSYVSSLPEEQTRLKLPFNLIDLFIAVGVIVAANFIVKAIGVSKNHVDDVAMLSSAAIISALAIKFRPNAKALVLLMASAIAFAYLLKPLGLIVSGFALVVIAAFGGHEFKWKEVIPLALGLVVFSVIVFVKGLTLPFPICPSFIETCPIR